MFKWPDEVKNAMEVIDREMWGLDVESLHKGNWQRYLESFISEAERYYPLLREAYEKLKNYDTHQNIPAEKRSSLEWWLDKARWKLNFIERVLALRDKPLFAFYYALQYYFKDRASESTRRSLERLYKDIIEVVERKIHSGILDREAHEEALKELSGENWQKILRPMTPPRIHITEEENWTKIFSLRPRRRKVKA